MKKIAPLKGLVLAGGDSRRMGNDKAAAEFAGQTMLARAAGTMQPVVSEVFVSARGRQRSLAGREHYQLIIDSVDIGGPAAGILSAHQHDPQAAWLVLACDMPLVTTQLLADLVRQRDPDCAATAWTGAAEGEAEPLCTVWEPATLASFLNQVLAGNMSGPQQWLRGQRLKLLDRPPGKALAGANTLDELTELQGIDADRKQHERKQ